MLGFGYRVHAMVHREKLGSTLFRHVFRNVLRNVFRNARHTSRPSIAMYTSFDCSCSFSFYGTEVLELKVGSPSTSPGKRQERSRTPPRFRRRWTPPFRCSTRRSGTRCGQFVPRQALWMKPR